MSKVILITGASSGIGLSVATYLSKIGYKVYGASRSAKPNSNFEVVKMDVTNEDMIHNVVENIISSEGRIDGLFNNAGVGAAGAFENTTVEDILKTYDTNVLGIVRTCQAVLPIMREQGSGHIINMSTLGSIMGLPYRAFYCSSKASVDMMTEALRLEVKRFGINVSLLSPGDVNTEIGTRRIISHNENDEVYGKVFTKTMQQLDEHVDDGLSPDYFGPVIHKILSSKRAKRNYYAGNFSEKLGVFLKKHLPDYLFEPIVMGYYKAE
jgi:NAD(P)-dependent dehydrogenase (short-subunit alcohol dehydrogenase family)